MAELVLMIDGVDRADLVRRGTLTIPDALQQRGTCRFVLDDAPLGAAEYRPHEGEPVRVEYDGVVVFAGTLERVAWHVENGTEPPMTVSACTAVDYNQLADRHLVARSYEGITAGAIVRDIVDRDLAGEGVLTVGGALQVSGSEVGPVAVVGTAEVGAIKYGGVEDGPVVQTATFTYVPAAQAFDELAELVGFYWNIDADKVLTFAPREQRVAPFAISEAATVDAAGNARSNFRAMNVERSREQYRNRQYVRGGQELTDERTEQFRGNGAHKTFTTAFPVARKPTVTVNAVAQTVGIKGVDEPGSHAWYWNQGVHEIVQDDGVAPLEAADTLAVTYYGSFPIVIASTQQAEVDARAAVEGGTGVYEHVDDDTSIESIELAQDKASALLRRYGKVPEVVEFETDQPGLKAGHLVRVYSPKHGVDADYLVEQTTYADVGVGDRFLRCSVTAVSGERLDTWVDFFRKVAASGRPFTLRENEQLALGRTMGEVVRLGDSLEVVQAGAASAEVGTAVVGMAELGVVFTGVTGSEVGSGLVGTAIVGRG